MSLIKETLPVVDEDLDKNQSNHRSVFKNSFQMLMTNNCTNKKSVVFPINELEKPTIDSVLNTVPLFYNPITKQLILQQDLEQQYRSINRTSTLTTTTTTSSPNNLSNKKCETVRLTSITKSSVTSDLKDDKACLDDLDKATIRKLNNFNDSLTNHHNQNKKHLKSQLVVDKKSTIDDDLDKRCSKKSNEIEERNYLETQLDDFTTKSINLNNLSQRPLVIKNCTNDHKSASFETDKKIDVDDSIKTIKLTVPTTVVNKKDKLDEFEKFDKLEKLEKLDNHSNQPNQTKKETYKTHRRTPSYIHDFHNVIKNNQNSRPNHQTKNHTSNQQINHSQVLPTITKSSVTAAISNLTKTSLVNATSTLSSTITTAKLNDNQMYSTSSNLSSSSNETSSKSSKQIVINESKNEFNFYDLDTDSETDCSLMGSKQKSISIDDDDIEPLKLPSPFLEKPKKFSLNSLQSVLSKLTSSKSSKSSSEQNNTKLTSSNNSSRRNSNAENVSSNLLTKSTNGLLIFENRPSNLPTKSEDEDKNHRLMVEQMIKDAKRKEQDDAKQIKKNIIRKKKDEDRMTNSIKIWQNEIMPHFDQLRNTKKVKELYSYGLPTNLRGKIWNLSIGNHLNLSDQSFDNYLAKWYDISLEQSVEQNPEIKDQDRIVNCLSKCSDESVYELIRIDVGRTFPALKLFQRNAPFHDKLLKLLGTYVIAYRPDIGYIQGMSFLLGMLLLNMDSKLAFVAFANLLNNSPVLMAFMKVDQRAMQAFYQTFDVYFQLNLPELYQHFKQQKLNTELFMIDWIYTLFTKVLPLDISTRVWDLFLRDGEEVIIKASLTLLKIFDKQLLQNDFINCAQFLTQLSNQSIPIDSTKFLTTLNGFNHLKPVTINKTKCKNIYSLFQHFNATSTNAH